MKPDLADGRAAVELAAAWTRRHGPRPAGSAAERAAQDELAALLEGWGFRVERLPAPFAPLPALNPVFVTQGLALMAAGWLWRAAPAGALALLAWAWAAPLAARWLLGLRGRTAQSQNVLAWLPGGDPTAPAVVLCAHVDSARVAGLRGARWLDLYNQSQPAVRRAAALTLALLASAALGLNLPGWSVTLSGVLCGLAGGWLALSDCINQLGHGGRYSPGAVDNASGVAAALLAARRLAEDDPRPPRLGVLLTGAEETGLHGARAAAEYFRARGERPFVICLDMVGAGDRLHWVSADGPWFPLRTDATLNAALRRADPGLLPLRYRQRSGDHAAFLRAGIPAAALQSSGSRAAELAYHSTADTPDLLDEATLARAVAAVVGAVRALRE